jgi:hypothetical protein
MKHSYQTPLILNTALALAESADGQQPPDTVFRDSSVNTAMGADALFHLNGDCS